MTRADIGAIIFLFPIVMWYLFAVGDKIYWVVKCVKRGTKRNRDYYIDQLCELVIFPIVFLFGMIGIWFMFCK